MITATWRCSRGKIENCGIQPLIQQGFRYVCAIGIHAIGNGSRHLFGSNQGKLAAICLRNKMLLAIAKITRPSLEYLRIGLKDLESSGVRTKASVVQDMSLDNVLIRYRLEIRGRYLLQKLVRSLVHQVTVILTGKEAATNLGRADVLEAFVFHLQQMNSVATFRKERIA